MKKSRTKNGEADQFKVLGFVPQGLKRCAGPCGRELPSNSDWFDSDTSREDNFYPWCKQCRKERREAKKLRAAQVVLEKFDQQILENMIRMPKGGSTLPHISELVQCAMEMYGGVQGFVGHMMANRVAAEPGGKVRQQIDANFTRLIEVLSDSSKVSPPPELMDDETLDQQLEQRTQQVRKLRDRTVLEGSAAEHEDELDE